MLVQYGYALITIVPCPLWFWYRWLSAGFLLAVFSWSIYNGATYYIDVFGTRFQKELEQLKKEVTRWQTSPDAMTTSGNATVTPQAQATKDVGEDSASKRNSSMDRIPMLESKDQGSTSVDATEGAGTRQRI